MKETTTGRRTFGSYRAEVFASGLAVLLMLGVAAYIVIAAIGRIGDEPEVATRAMVVVGSIGLVVNLVALVLLRGGAGESLNVKGAYLEVVADTVGSVGVIVAGLLVAATGSSVWDTVIALAISAFVAVRAVLLGREVLAVLGQHAPAGMVPAEAEAALRGVGAVVDVHDLDPDLRHARGDGAPGLRRRRRPDRGAHRGGRRAARPVRDRARHHPGRAAKRARLRRDELVSRPGIRVSRVGMLAAGRGLVVR